MASIEKRIADDGTVSFRVKVRLKGFPPQTSTHQRLTDARRWAQHTEAAIREGRHFKTAEAKRHTLAEMIERYRRTVLPSKPKTAPDQAKQLAWWSGRLGAYALADVTPAMLAEARDDLLAGTTAKGCLRSPSTVVRYMAALSHSFSVAVKEWGWLDGNPMLRVSKPKEPRGRVRFLSDDERQRLVAACQGSSNPQLLLAVVLAISTGMRKNEIMRLSWADIDLARGRLVLHETKNGERRSIPIVNYALDLLTRASKVRRLDTALLFPGLNPKRPIDLRSAWETALQTAGIEDFRFHDLRHTCASYLAMNGATLAEIAEILGHKTLSMVKRYAHLSEAHSSKVVERMNATVFGSPSNALQARS